MTETFKLKDAAVRQHVVSIEPMDNDEVRWRHFVRQAGTSRFNHRSYVWVTALRTVQGVPGKKPRMDTGTNTGWAYYSELPGETQVVDGSTVNHDWTDAYEGIMIVTAFAWTGIYVNSKLIHKISPHERPHHGDEPALALSIAQAVAELFDEEIAIAHATQVWTAGCGVLPDDLTQMRLSFE